MFTPVVTKNPTAVAAEVNSIYREMFPDGDPLFVPRMFAWTAGSFTGNHPDYQAIDARYHDFEHTLQGTLCFARLLHARARTAATPALTRHYFELGLIAILLHDSGYLKRRDDTAGTGAKYTVTHVSRSADFAAVLLREKGYNDSDILAVRNMISCTGVDAALGSIPFQSELEKLVGFALGTADLLGQMAAEDYVDKLPVLYSEFAEAAQHSTSRSHMVTTFSNADELIRKTPDFWEKYVLNKLKGEFQGLYRFLNQPYPDGPNWYLERVERNIARIRTKFPPRS